MALRIVTGRSGGGKTMLCLDEIKGRLRAKEPGMSFYLVPEQSNLEAEHNLIAHCGVDGMIDAAVLTFRRISHRVFSEIGGRNRQYISNVGKRICLSSVVRENIESLVFYRGQSRTPGFIDDLAALFSEFKQYRLTADMIEAAARRLDAQGAGAGDGGADSGDGEGGGSAPNQPLSMQLRELALLYRAYNRRIDSEYLDVEDDLTRLADVLYKSGTIRASHIWVDGFSGFTVQEYNVICELMKYAKSVTVCLCCNAVDSAGAATVAAAATGAAAVAVAAATGSATTQTTVAPGAPALYDLTAVAPVAGTPATQAAPPANVRLTVPRAPSLFAPTEETAAELMRIATDNRITVTHTHVYAKQQNSRATPELLHLERNLFRSPAKVYRGINQSVFISECPDRYAEAELAVAGILELCRDQGYRYEDIAVVSPDPDAYAPLVESVLFKHGLRCFIDAKKDITGQPLIKLILSLFSIIESDYAYEHVFSYLKSGLTDIPRSDIDMLENYVLERGIRGGLWKHGDAWRGSGLEDVRARFLRPVALFENAALNADAPESFCTALLALLDECGARQKINGILHSANRAREGGSRHSEWLQIWSAVVDIMDQMVQLGRRECSANPPGAGNAAAGMAGAADSADAVGAAGTTGAADSADTASIEGAADAVGSADAAGAADSADTARSAHEQFAVYANMFRCGVNSYKIGAIPPAADEILVGGVDRAGSRKVKALFLLGASEGLFPGASKPASLLNDHNRIEIRSAGLAVAKDTLSALLDSQFKVYQALTFPSHRLSITWPASSGRGAAAKPAYAVKLLMKMFQVPAVAPPKTPETAPDNDFLVRTISRDGAFEALICELRKSVADAAPLSDTWATVRDWFVADDSYKVIVESLLPSLCFREARVRLSAQTADILSKPDAVSVSRLERYAACPFSYLGEFLVRARPRKEHTLEAPDIGTFVHKAMELSVRELSDEGLFAGLTFSECLERSSAVVERMLESGDDSAFMATYRNRYQKERIKETIAWGIYATSRQISSGIYRPWRYEESFEFCFGQTPIKLRGIIDRIDIAETGGKVFMRVVDYKTGNKKLTLSDIVNGFSLQLPIYLDAALKIAAPYFAQIDDAHADLCEPLPGGLFYFEMRQPWLDAHKKGRAALKTGADTQEGRMQSLLNQLTINGYVIGDEDFFEKTYEQDIRINQASRIVGGVSYKKDGAFTARVFAPSPEEYPFIRDAVTNCVRNINNSMSSGIYDASPYKKPEGAPCVYCGYRGACGIDAIKRDGFFRVIDKLSDRAMMSRLKTGYANAKDSGAT